MKYNFRSSFFFLMAMAREHHFLGDPISLFKKKKTGEKRIGTLMNQMCAVVKTHHWASK